MIADGETGLIVPPGDAHALAGALLALDRDADRRRAMGYRGAERARTRFSRRAYAEGIVAACRASLA